MPRVDDGYLEARRSQIMDAAITCFAREGFHRTTMQDIIAETGLSAGAICRYACGRGRRSWLCVTKLTRRVSSSSACWKRAKPARC